MHAKRYQNKSKYQWTRCSKPSASPLGNATALKTAINTFGDILGDFRPEGVDLGTID